MKTYLLVLSIMMLCLSCGQRPETDQSAQRMFVGTYTQKMGHVDGKGEGIYYMEATPENGWEVKQVAATLENPSFVKASKDGKFLYAVSELGPGSAESGFIHSYRIGDNGVLEPIGKLPTGNYAPCHIAMDPQQELVFVANYAGSPVNVYKRLPDGNLAHFQTLEIPTPQGSHPHSVAVSKDGKALYIADLGNDRIWIFQRAGSQYVLHPDKSAALEEGAGPRHLSLSADGTRLYCANELNNSVWVFSVEPDAGLRKLQHMSTLPQDFTGTNYVADIHLHPRLPYLYVSNRGHNSIAIFKVEKEGTLQWVGFSSTRGETPRNFTISPTTDQLLVANQDSDDMVIFNIDESGLLSLESQVQVPSPVSLEWY